MDGRKPWREMTPAEITELKKRQCIKCAYFSQAPCDRRNDTYVANKTCDYLITVGHSRGCDPRDCVKEGKFKPLSKRKNRKAVLF